ncbi:MAG: YncE family protein [Legionellaceae bacterium]|nr:YncE family protein [Legionellaceae bacterium]
MMTWIIRHAFLLLILSGALQAAPQAKFAVEPTAGTVTAALLPSNFKQNVQYQVTNNTQTTRTLTTVPIAGVSQITTGVGACSSPFTLAPQQSCLLDLQVNASQMSASGILGGPKVCKAQGGSANPDLFLCSEPSPAQSLGFSSSGFGQFIFVLNQGSGTLSSCQLGSEGGLLGGCSVAATGFTAPEALTINPHNNMLYITDSGTNTISRCPFDRATGTVGECFDAGGTGFDLPFGVSISPDGTMLYASNGGGAIGVGIGSVSACTIDASTGELSGCINNRSATFDLPSDMTINNTGTLAYVSNFTANTISVCNIVGTTVTSCDDSSGNNFDGPEGIMLSPSGAYAYITNNTSNSVTRCAVDHTGSGLLSSCVVTEGNFDGTGNLAFNLVGDTAYVPNEALNQLFMCSVQSETGGLFNCVDSLGSGFDRPAGVLVR